MAEYGSVETFGCAPDGKTYGAHAGIALEPQTWPDAPNHAYYPTALLIPGETYRQIAIVHALAA